MVLICERQANLRPLSTGIDLKLLKIPSGGNSGDNWLGTLVYLGIHLRLWSWRQWVSFIFYAENMVV